MSRKFDLECLTVALERAEEYAVRTKLDQSVVSEIRHLKNVVNANKENDNA